MRSRSHILEEESFTQFKALFPSEWVVRKKPDDYGIDAEVEVFNLGGKATGVVFWVQLKATDSKESKTQMAIRMEVAKIKQLASYDLPVALFRYNSDKKTFYYDWIKRYCYLAASVSNKTYDIKFQKHHIWNKESTSRLIDFLKRKNRINSGLFSFPLKAYINNIETPNKTAIKLSSDISKNISSITLIRERELADIEINLLSNRIVLNLYNIFGGSSGFQSQDIANQELVFQAFKDCLLLVIYQTDKDNELFNFINNNDLLPQLLNHPGILKYVMPKLLASESGNHYTKEVVDHVFRFGDMISKTMVQSIIFLNSENILSSDRVETYFDQLISIGLENSDAYILSTSYYNFAGYHRGKGGFERAVHYYNKAYKTDPTYLKRGYFCRELAGVLFELQFYKLSAKFYRMAIVLEPKNIVLLSTLADAEFYSGNYEGALNHFDDFLTRNVDQEHDKYESSIKYTICKYIVEYLGVKTQKRKCLELQRILLSQKKDEMNMDDFNRLFKHDVLNTVLWIRYSVFAMRNKDMPGLFMSSLIQAALVKGDAQMWAYVTILTTYEEPTAGLLNDIVNMAYFYCREGFILELQEMIDNEEDENFNGEDFLKYVQYLINAPREYPKELRLWNGNESRIIEIV